MRQFDQQIVESVALRRQRTRNAVFFGPHRWRRQLQDHVKPFVMGLVVTAVIAAGCVGTSFVMKLLLQQPQPGQQSSVTQRSASAAPPPTPTPKTSATPTRKAASSQPTRTPTPSGSSTR